MSNITAIARKCKKCGKILDPSRISLCKNCYSNHIYINNSKCAITTCKNKVKNNKYTFCTDCYQREISSMPSCRNGCGRKIINGRYDMCIRCYREYREKRYQEYLIREEKRIGKNQKDTPQNDIPQVDTLQLQNDIPEIIKTDIGEIINVGVIPPKNIRTTTFINSWADEVDDEVDE